MKPTVESTPIRQVQDRSFSANVSHASLCPNMDLLAVVLDGNSIAIFRLSWSRLATISVTTGADETITSLVWSPSGAHVAVGTSTGLLCIHSVDRAASAPPSRTRRAARDSEPVATLRLSVSALSILWMKVPNRRVVYTDRSSQLIDSRPPAVAEDGLLFVGGIDGTVTVLATNLAFTIACIKILPDNFSVCRLHMTSDQRHCVAIGYVHSHVDRTNTKNNSNTENSTSSSIPSETGRYMIRAMRTDFLLKNWSEIERVSLEAAALQSQLPAIKRSVRQVEEAWSEGVREVLATGIAALMDKAMREFTQNGNIWDELYDIFCGSKVHGAALHCLVHLMGEGGAKEYLRSFRAHDDDAEAAIATLMPLVQNLLSRASEYSGLICLADQFSEVGVQTNDTEEMFFAAEGLFVEICDLSRELEAASNETESFLAWLVIATVKASGETTQSRLSSNPPILGGKELEFAGNFFEKMTAITTTGEEPVSTNAIAVMLRDKIQPAIKRIDAASEAIIQKPFEAISKALPLAGGISLNVYDGSVTVGRNWSILDSASANGKECQVMALTTEYSGSLLWVRYKPMGQQWTTGRITLRTETSEVKGTALIANGCMMLARSRVMSGDVMSDEKVHDIGVYDPGNEIWKSGQAVICRHDEAFFVNPNDVAMLDKPLHTETVKGCKELKNNAPLEINHARGVGW